MPISAFRLAPSQYTNPPFLCTISAISVIFNSKMPSVLGFVSIIAATSSSISEATVSLSTIPSLLDFTGTALKPHILTLAGFVPCAVSGIRTLILASFLSAK
ncbi:hypothetical protein ES703_88781 [subsurface metagenome]